jgi:serine/threonine-protein kinase ULK2
LYLIVEYCNNGNLERLLQKSNGRVSEYQSKKILKDIVQGYKCLYEHSIVHRDLKPANILQNDGDFKISDFGFSKVVEASMEDPILVSYVGSP